MNECIVCGGTGVTIDSFVYRDEFGGDVYEDFEVECERCKKSEIPLTVTGEDCGYNGR